MKESEEPANINYVFRLVAKIPKTLISLYRSDAFDATKLGTIY
jgi:hypothetical protein